MGCKQAPTGHWCSREKNHPGECVLWERWWFMVAKGMYAWQEYRRGRR